MTVPSKSGEENKLQFEKGDLVTHTDPETSEPVDAQVLTDCEEGEAFVALSYTRRPKNWRVSVGQVKKKVEHTSKKTISIWMNPTIRHDPRDRNMIS